MTREREARARSCERLIQDRSTRRSKGNTVKLRFSMQAFEPEPSISFFISWCRVYRTERYCNKTESKNVIGKN